VPIKGVKKIFFCSDHHFGINVVETSRKRQEIFISWIEEYQDQMDALYIVGDLFDFWFEYSTVVPKGGIRVLAALGNLVIRGVPVYYFTGNHDQWAKSYFTTELGIMMFSDPILVKHQDRNLLIGHGDGLGPGDHGYKFIKRVFRNPLARWVFQWIHPDVGIRMARFWSRRSRAQEPGENAFLGPGQEWLIQYAEAEAIKNPSIDYFIFGHRHLPIDWDLATGKRYINLGDWLRFYSYAVLDQGELKLHFYRDASQRPFSNHI
jgi:UDP-2,3-diacylglucosamine hydrolase